jgi:hypothetical protein
MKHKDPFLGEIELKKLGETSRHLMGESIIETIYIDDLGNYYIDTWLIGSERQPMNKITKVLFDRITEFSKQIND